MMIKVLKLEYWEGSKFLIRQDVDDSDVFQRKLKARMKNKFLALSPMEQRRWALEWARSGGGMVKKTMVTMDEEEYLNVEKLKD